mmetsp:Transcript_43467/g.130389  ORF Transcript_43467/g.130389 Transcript_43467/m.130389 type:complete len:222 (-) Transcript_43467:607-1272(-)
MAKLPQSYFLCRCHGVHPGSQHAGDGNDSFARDLLCRKELPCLSAKDGADAHRIDGDDLSVLQVDLNRREVAAPLVLPFKLEHSCAGVIPAQHVVVGAGQKQPPVRHETQRQDAAVLCSVGERQVLTPIRQPSGCGERLPPNSLAAVVVDHLLRLNAGHHAVLVDREEASGVAGLCAAAECHAPHPAVQLRHHALQLNPWVFEVLPSLHALPRPDGLVSGT